GRPPRAGGLTARGRVRARGHRRGGAQSPAFRQPSGLLAPWNEGRPPQLPFPNATYLVRASHRERPRHPHGRVRASFIPELPAVLEDSGRREVVDGPCSQALGETVRFSFSDGHTPGLMLAEILGPELVDGQPHGGVVFCADLIPGRSWVHLPITMGYDRNAELLIDDKRAFLEDQLARNVHVVFTHDLTSALALVVRDEKGRYRTTHQVAELVLRPLVAHRLPPRKSRR